jgi:signal transduction histidine kinase
MKASSGFKPKSIQLARRYAAGLRQYLALDNPANLKVALDVGRQAVKIGLDTLDLALIHEQALIPRGGIPAGSPAARNRFIQRTGIFFAETILPLEETHRAALEANAHLDRLNRTLNRRSQDLAASNLRLKNQIIRRQKTEKNLRQSERHSSRLLEQSKYLQEELRLLSRRILSVQEEERKRISRELHNVVAQMLTCINVRLATLKLEAAANTQGLSRKISRAQRLVEKSVDVVHRFARDLRPAMLDDLGLIPALHSHLKEFTKATGIRVSLTAFAGVEALNSAQRTALYRVAQEALNNIAQHAQASKGEVILAKVGNTIRMQIKDNGKSFDVDRVLNSRKIKRLGLLGMRERMEMVGGSFSVKSVPHQGSIIQAEIPFIRNAPKTRRS